MTTTGLFKIKTPKNYKSQEIQDLRINNKIQTFNISAQNIKNDSILIITNPKFITQCVIKIYIPYLKAESPFYFKIINSTIDSTVTIYTSGGQIMHGSFLPTYGVNNLLIVNKSCIEFLYSSNSLYLKI